MDHRLLTRDQILTAAELRTETVDCPEWGGAVRIRELSASHRDAFEASCFAGEGKDRKFTSANMRAKLVALSAVGADGAPLFTLADAEALGKLSAGAMDRCFQAAQRLSGLRVEDVEAHEGN